MQVHSSGHLEFNDGWKCYISVSLFRLESGWEPHWHGASSINDRLLITTSILWLQKNRPLPHQVFNWDSPGTTCYSTLKMETWSNIGQSLANVAKIWLGTFWVTFDQPVSHILVGC